jgi:hypothetical protein
MYDLILLIGGGVIGAVVGIYYSRMIPPPNADFLSLRLFLSLVVATMPFLVALFAMRWILDYLAAN